ncbi:class I SAM-dependent methyltransferase [Paractinoplanes ferrugineus]|uniref:class I SAM-dependent methyltransferase n=1 Tax=Paractinoplanes ferrugineus TaxID=113564 RepID=UPI0019411BC3|nr:class I SAM-dependent methyltransferase [Actinoplanes ferrugineus]
MDRSGTAYARLYLDPDLNHSSGYFTTADMSLAQAQRTKIDTVLTHCRVERGHRLLDVGSGWGAAAITAARDLGADVVGITLDPDQDEYARERLARLPGAARVDFRVQNWESFAEPVDRIICVNAFENFTAKREFFPHCRTLLQPGGVMVVLAVTADRPMFRVLAKDAMIRSAADAGFDVQVSASLAPHYVRTLEHFVVNLTANRDEAVRLRPASDVDRHLRYYSQCADYLRTGVNDMFEFTLVAC